MKIASTGDIFDQPPGQMRWTRGKLADHVGDHVVSSPGGAVLVTSPETKSPYPRPPQSLNLSYVDVVVVCMYRLLCFCLSLFLFVCLFRDSAMTSAVYFFLSVNFFC